ncbi:MAG: biopolymer transporter ExbD [Candidatus Thiodiazotropha sp. 6PLUC2]
MAFLNQGSSGCSGPRAEINMIPLIDVMLVLLVIFMVTAPLLTHAVKLDLPKASSQPREKASKVEIAIDATGGLYWDGDILVTDDLENRFAALANHSPETEIHLYADKSSRYEVIADVMTTASRAGLSHIGFITEPEVTH